MNRCAKLSIINGLMVILLSVGCQHSMEPKVDFKKMEIKYTKVGGWIPPIELDIHANGLVLAYSAQDSASTTLNKKDQNKIASLFASFSSYDRYYEPEEWVTDQNTHAIILVYDNVPDTVSVYMPEKAEIPLSLTKIIAKMESLWSSVLKE